MASREKAHLKSLASLVFFLIFLWGVGIPSLFPSLRLLKDISWDSSFFFPTWGQRFISFLWIVPVGLGFLGWNRWFRGLFFAKIEKSAADLLGFSLTLTLFSLFISELAVNGILYWPLTALFFVVTAREGWKELKGFIFEGIWEGRAPTGWWLLPLFLWAFEYFSPPLVWDAILDHFRYAREIARLHQMPFHWVNHTGDMPKAAELVLAGFWSLGGEPLSKLSLALPALLTGWLLALFAREWNGKSVVAAWIFWTCPYFLALYAFGYVEGFLAFLEVLALFCFWRGIQEPKGKIWFSTSVFFLGVALTIKYTAVLAIGAIGAIWIYRMVVRRDSFRLSPVLLLAFVVPFSTWLFKNWLAFRDPFYPLGTSIFGSSIGYSPEMEKGLLIDTGVPWGMGIGVWLKTFWNSFFTSSNAVNAAWTPLFVMSLPWIWPTFKNKHGRFLWVFTFVFFAGWGAISSSIRHVSGGALVLVLLAAIAWERAFKERGGWAKPLFAAGTCLSLALCLSTQLTTTAPYACALGLEDPLARLRRHYSYSMDTYRAYRYIEEHSETHDKVMAFAVWQTYPLERTAFVDFKWKKPIFLEWASHCRTADQLAQKFREEGVTYLLLQIGEAGDMSKEEKDFKLEGMPFLEYKRFWNSFLVRVFASENIGVYRVIEARPE